MTVGATSHPSKAISTRPRPVAATRVAGVSLDPLLLIGEVDRATDRLLRTAAGFDADELAAASLLPGWTRGHVLAHLAREADNQTLLLTAARDGVEVSAYPDRAARDAEAAAGATRPPAAHLDDLRRSADRFAAAVAAMPPQAWSATVPTHGGPRVAATVVWARLRELEVHHLDLAAGYRTDDWTEPFAHRLLHQIADDLRGRDVSPGLVLRFDGSRHELVIGDRSTAPTVAGPPAELAAWLIGRSAGDVLTVTPDAPPPTPVEWI